MRLLNKMAIVTSLLAGTSYAAGLETVQQKVYDLMDKDISSITFSKGDASLSASEKTSLRSVVNAVRDDDNIDKIIVATWADEQLPTNRKIELSKSAKDLAEKRGDNVKDVLKELGASDVEIHSMAEQPLWIEKVFGTDDAQVKDSLAGKKVDDREPRKIAEILADKGGASKAVVIVKRKNSYAH
ncbi:MAG: OmpA family protein [Oligoflexales bacterium]